MKVYTAADALNYKAEELVVVRDESILFVEREYRIPLHTIRSKTDIVSWVHHLANKNWITTEMISQFVEKACSHLGVNVYESGEIR